MHRLRASCPRQQLASLHLTHLRCTGCYQQRWNSSHVEQSTSSSGRIFVTHKEPDGEIWYSIKRKATRIKKPEDPNFFEMPSIVIDLDEEGRRDVRTLDEEAEIEMNERALENPRRHAMNEEVCHLQHRVEQLRKSWADILAQPLSPWRITHHDVVSIALRGVEESSSAKTYLRTAQEDPGLLDLLCKNNGIPEYARNDDISMLEWLLLRKSAMEQHLLTHGEQFVTASDFVQAVQHADSLPKLRRTITAYLFGSLGNERSDAESFSGLGMASLAIRDKIVEFIGDREDSSQLATAMAISGNVESALASGHEESALLWGFNLSLASSHSLPAMTQTISRGLDTGSAIALPQNHQITLNALETAVSRFEEPDTAEAWQLPEPSEEQALFQVLVGFNTLGQEERSSIRSLLHKAKEAGREVFARDVRHRMCLCYFALLGRLGAFRTLWFEFHSLNLMMQQDEVELLRENIATVISVAASARPPHEGELSPMLEEDATLEACVTGDYNAMRARHEVNGGEQVTTVDRTVDTADLKLGLGGSLREWLEVLASQ